MNNVTFVKPSNLWINYLDLSEEQKIKLEERQYRRQLKLSHGYIPLEDEL